MSNPIDIFTGKEAEPFSALNSKYEFTFELCRELLLDSIENNLHEALTDEDVELKLNLSDSLDRLYD